MNTIGKAVSGSGKAAIGTSFAGSALTAVSTAPEKLSTLLHRRYPTVAVTGMTGVGKTRLVDRLARRTTPEAVTENGIDKHIRYGQKVVAANWSDEDRRWELTIDRGGEEIQLNAGFLWACSGYYNYDTGYRPHFEGEEGFQGRIVHPQKWTSDIDYAGKRVVVVGAGAMSSLAAMTVARQVRTDLHVVNRTRATADRLATATGGTAHDWDELATDIFTDDFLLTRPLLRAIRNTQPTVLLIDELDKADVEVEGLLLEVLSDFQVTVPELGTISATQRPFVVLTSNAARDLSEALRRRCLFLHIDYPTPALEQRIVELKVPGLDAALVESVVRLVHRLRQMPLRKAPSVAETVDWARTLIALGADGTGDLDATVLRANLGVLLKHQDDIERASTLLKLDA